MRTRRSRTSRGKTRRNEIEPETVGIAADRFLLRGADPEVGLVRRQGCSHARVVVQWQYECKEPFIHRSQPGAMNGTLPVLNHDLSDPQIRKAGCGLRHS